MIDLVCTLAGIEGTIEPLTRRVVVVDGHVRQLSHAVGIDVLDVRHVQRVDAPR